MKNQTIRKLVQKIKANDENTAVIILDTLLDLMVTDRVSRKLKSKDPISVTKQPRKKRRVFSSSKRWSKTEESILTGKLRRSAKVRELMKLGRSRAAIACRANKLGIAY